MGDDTEHEGKEKFLRRAQQLKALRLARGYRTQDELANATGISQVTISRWEKGDRDMMCQSAERLAKFFEVPLDIIYGIAPLSASDDELLHDPYPNRRRLRQLPEFAAAPRVVQDFLISMRWRRGDIPYFEWVDEFRRALKLHGRGDIEPGEPK